jgi:hypothetical protein
MMMRAAQLRSPDGDTQVPVLVAGYLLIRRAADFDKAKPEGTRPAAEPRAGAQRARPGGSR